MKDECVSHSFQHSKKVEFVFSFVLAYIVVPWALHTWKGLLIGVFAWTFLVVTRDSVTYTQFVVPRYQRRSARREVAEE